jgi:hypothetical protein
MGSTSFRSTVTASAGSKRSRFTTNLPLFRHLGMATVRITVKCNFQSNLKEPIAPETTFHRTPTLTTTIP